MDPDLTSLFLLPEGSIERFAARFGGLSLLTAEERARYRRLPAPGTRRRYLGARVLSRYALSARTGRPVDEWTFRTGRYGRPEARPEGDGMRFNLSHTKGLIVCAVTQGRSCGVDVERKQVSAEAVAHVSRHVAADERAQLAALPPAARSTRFSELWVLKEAYLKAMGTGLQRSLSGFCFPIASASEAIRVQDSEHPAASARWRFDLIHPGPQHVLAVAVEDGRGGSLRITDLSDLVHSVRRPSSSTPRREACPPALQEPAVPGESIVAPSRRRVQLPERSGGGGHPAS
jgi:4'-phosphopantetheinyl transferase